MYLRVIVYKVVASRTERKGGGANGNYNESIAKMADRIIYIKDGKAQDNKINTEKISASDLIL